MRTATAFVLGLLLASPAFAAGGAPSDEVLAQMGLGGIEVMSDDQAANVRGMGFLPTVSFDGFHLYKHSFKEYKQNVKQYHKIVKRFQHKIEKTVSKWPTGVKHGGKRW